MKNPLVKLWLIVGIVSGFTSLVFFIITYLNEKVLCDLHCRQKNEIVLVLVLLSLFGVFVGSSLYYFFSEKYRKKIVKISKDASVTLNFLDLDSKKIVKTLITHEGSLNQSEIHRKTGLSKAKVSRLITKMNEKGLLEKEPNGMTNNIILSNELKELFLDE